MQRKGTITLLDTLAVPAASVPAPGVGPAPAAERAHAAADPRAWEHSPPAVAPPLLPGEAHWLSSVREGRRGAAGSDACDMRGVAAEKGVEHSFDAGAGGGWRTRAVLVRVQQAPFGRGAMRQCFHARKRYTHRATPEFENVCRGDVGSALRGVWSTEHGFPGDAAAAVASRGARIAAALGIEDTGRALLARVRAAGVAAVAEAAAAAADLHTTPAALHAALAALVEADEADEAHWRSAPTWVFKNFVAPDTPRQLYYNDIEMQVGPLRPRERGRS